MRLPHRPYVQHQRERSAPRSILLALGALTLVTGLNGCSGDDPATPGAEPTSGPAAAPDTPSPEPVLTTASIDKIDGDLDASRRGVLKSRVSGAVDAWIDSAYGGTYPRDDFSEAFGSFTKNATRRAKQDADLLSNAGVGLEVDDVQAVRRRVHLDVLGVAGRPVAVTARVDLVFKLTGEITRRDAISGRLYLTFDKSSAGDTTPGWRIFGYDLHRKEA